MADVTATASYRPPNDVDLAPVASQFIDELHRAGIPVTGYSITVKNGVETIFCAELSRNCSRSVITKAQSANRRVVRQRFGGGFNLT